MRENDAGMVFVANLTALPIESAEEFDVIYRYVLETPKNLYVTSCSQPSIKASVGRVNKFEPLIFSVTCSADD